MLSALNGPQFTRRASNLQFDCKFIRVNTEYGSYILSTVYKYCCDRCAKRNRKFTLL